MDTNKQNQKEGWKIVKVRPVVKDGLDDLARMMASDDPPAEGKVIAALVRHAKGMEPKKLQAIYEAWNNPQELERRLKTGTAGSAAA